MKLLSLAILSAAGLLGTAAAHAQTVNPVPAATIINSLPYTIGSSGFYQLGADLNSSLTTGTLITITANNVTLDFGGHYISGPTNNTQTSQVFGVQATDVNNITIQNGTISHCYQCIKFTTSSSSQLGVSNLNQTVSNVLMNFPYRTGVYFVNTTGGRVLNCRIANVGGSQYGGLHNCAIEMDGGTGYSFSDNTITNSNYGIYSPLGDFSVARRNTIITATYGLYNVSKYQDNLTASVTTPFIGDGTDAGGNN